jgi:hypothetical protein
MSYGGPYGGKAHDGKCTARVSRITVIPAKAGIQGRHDASKQVWAPLSLGGRLFDGGDGHLTLGREQVGDYEGAALFHISLRIFQVSPSRT